MAPRTFQSEFTRACIYGHCQVPVDENELLEHLLGVRTWHYTLYTTNRCNGRLYFRRCRLPKKNAIYKTGANYLSTFLGGYSKIHERHLPVYTPIRMHLLPRSTTVQHWYEEFNIRCTRYLVVSWSTYSIACWVTAGIFKYGYSNTFGLSWSKNCAVQ